MSEQSGAHHAQDRAAHLHRALAEDGRTAEQGVGVSLVDETVVLTGTVTTEERRTQIEHVVREQLPHADIDNRVEVTPLRTPRAAEELGH
ncbi:BON domain-containing protein [Nocardia sp. NPDC003693]